MPLDPETSALLAHLAAMGGGADRTMDAADPASVRAASQAMWAGLNGPDTAGCAVRPVVVPGPGRPLAARLYRPSAVSADAPLPLVLFLHGGGWAMGDLDGYEFLVKALCAASGAAFLSLDYRLAPENKYPAALEDGLSALRWAQAETARLGVDAARLAVMGDSAGGNLAAVIALRLRSDGWLRLAAQFLLYPMLDVASAHEAYPSRGRCGDGGYLISRHDIDVTTGWYLPAPALARDPTVSPLLADDLRGLPPAVIVTAGYDPLRDEAAAYAQKLRTAGASVDYRCFDSTIHAFLSFGGLAVAQEGRAHLAQQIKRLLFAALA